MAAPAAIRARAGGVAACLLVLALATPTTAEASRVFRWTDANGVTHYGDHRPQEPVAGVATLPAFVEPGASARLRIEPRAGEHHVWADNQLSGPIEVMLHYARQHNSASDPALPARATVPARGSALVAVLRPVNPERTLEFQLRMDTLPGDPGAAPRDVLYVRPVGRDVARIDQGYGGSFSHHDAENRYAVDFAVPIGTPVLAARDGVVMQTEGGFESTGLDRDTYAGRANFIRLLHDDGAMSLYAHLQVEGVLVRPGQRVRAGQQIGLSGNTGFTTGPHLHFAVQVNRGMRLQSLPFRMHGLDGAGPPKGPEAPAPAPAAPWTPPKSWRWR